MYSYLAIIKKQKEIIGEPLTLESKGNKFSANSAEFFSSTEPGFKNRGKQVFGAAMNKPHGMTAYHEFMSSLHSQFKILLMGNP